jgi:hypothetical protein
MVSTENKTLSLIECNTLKMGFDLAELVKGTHRSCPELE